MTVGVWVGNFDRTPLRNSSGVTGAAPIFHDVLLAAQAHVRGPAARGVGSALAEPDERPAARRACARCPGCRAGESARRSSASGCARRRRRGRLRLASPRRDRLAVRYPAALPRLGARAGPAGRGRGRRAGWRDPRPAEARAPARLAEPGEGLRIVNPPAGAAYLRDPTLRAAFQTLPLRAAGSAPGTLRWEVNGDPVGTSTVDVPLDWPLRSGSHTIVVTDGQGRQDRTTIVVR